MVCAAMRMIRKINTASLKPWLCGSTVPLLVSSRAALDAPQSPWERCRAASRIEYESAESEYLLQTSVGAYAKTGPWWCLAGTPLTDLA
jgi:hypothetical protein